LKFIPDEARFTRTAAAWAVSMFFDKPKIVGDGYET